MTPPSRPPQVPTPQGLLRKATRRQEYSATTKKALVDVAAERFTAQGYAGTSLDEIVAGARVTKGALYHHFKGKQDLFEAVFVEVEDAAASGSSAHIKAPRIPGRRPSPGCASSSRSPAPTPTAGS